ncbi:oxygen-dependent coproporphyrinogen oxidase [Marinifilum caeruleilacunae]|uniref:coproporphyrinogen oxidase n=1 Tax=Marinifilum caeruleilacunae TaxID=2499076 RepID=A0ABX1WTC8_9BACT|nr:oxygen-dependent coproporphyrinogen oxidase [Marinifilum caeruleilacunae]NOU59355.1 oxygen-dependent coproporphyrinogen oxidase [Marinifilum caeruleilacunae]
MQKDEIAEKFKHLQNQITKALENCDGGAKFQEDVWEREAGGGGRSRVIKNGNIIEKGGVQFSAVHGAMPAKIKSKLNLSADDFFATGVSLIMHPENPHVPIIHMNVRYFELSDGTYWFGGGIDLTPIYVDKNQAKAFHQELKKVCDKHHPDFYSKFKPWADDYFFLPFRNETRGVGGIFFDHLNDSSGMTKEELFDFVMEVGELFAPTYCEIMRTNASKLYSEQEKDWQLHRRGRYVEFNLVLDKGTKFGLDTNGRTESILVSMPPEVKWTYQYEIKEGSKEAETLQLLKKDINWLEPISV